MAASWACSAVTCCSCKGSAGQRCDGCCSRSGKEERLLDQLPTGAVGMPLTVSVSLLRISCTSRSSRQASNMGRTSAGFSSCSQGQAQGQVWCSTRPQQ